MAGWQDTRYVGNRFLVNALGNLGNHAEMFFHKQEVMMLALVLLAYTMPLDSPYMEYIEYLQVRGLVEIPYTRPYELGWIIGQMDYLIVNDAGHTELDRRIISQFTPLVTKNEDFSYLLHGYIHYAEPEYYRGFIDYRAGGRLAPHTRFTHALRFQRASDIDSAGPEPWKDFQVYLTEGLVQMAYGKVKIDVGRRNFLLGYGVESGLLLSPASEGYDGFMVRVPLRYIEFSNIFTILDASQNRCLTFHRIGFHLKRFLNIGFSEALLFGGTFEPLYLNPFFPYYLSQWGIDRDDNIMWSFDAQIRLAGTVFSAELLIDDYMYEDDPYPDKLAYKVRMATFLLDRLLTKVSYTFVDKWVYTKDDTITVYEHNGVPLGFPLGNDVDHITGSLMYVNTSPLWPYVRMTYTRKGEGSIYLPYEIEGGDWTPPFPSGTVEKTLEMVAGARAMVHGRFVLRGEVGRISWKNYQHTAGDDRDDTFFTITLWAML